MKALLFSLMLIPGVSQAALIKLNSIEAHKVIHRTAELASKTFVLQTEAREKTESHPEAIGDGCAEAKKNILEDLELLEISGSSDLLAAKSALEQAKCAEDSEKSMELSQAQNQFFTATVYLRATDRLY